MLPGVIVQPNPAGATLYNALDAKAGVSKLPLISPLANERETASKVIATEASLEDLFFIV